MRLLPLRVPGVEVDAWTVAPLWRLDDHGDLSPRSPGVEAAATWEEADLGALVALWGAHPLPARKAIQTHLDAASARGARVLVWVEGDQEIDLDHPAAVLFEQGPERSRPRSGPVHAWPVLIHDHLRDRFAGAVDPVARGDRPSVGFCGQAGAPWTGHARLLAGKARLRAAHALGRTDRLAGPWASHLRLRRRALDLLAADDRIATDFVVRDRYRAGVTTHAERADRTSPTATEFFANIRRTAYTVCVRGGGNFSTRLYETLCLGRIPIIIDTDMVLPWSGRVAWDDLAVVIPADRLDRLAERVVAHHAALDDSAFAERQRACRELWEQRLSVDGFFAHLPELLDGP